MAKVYAIFDDDAALQQATANLDYKDYEIIVPEENSGQPSGDPEGDVGKAAGVPVIAGTSAMGGSSTGVPILVERDLSADRSATDDYDRRLDDLPEDERRSFRNALKDGSQILIVKRADENTVQMLKDAGASSVSSR